MTQTYRLRVGLALKSAESIAMTRQASDALGMDLSKCRLQVDVELAFESSGNGNAAIFHFDSLKNCMPSHHCLVRLDISVVRKGRLHRTCRV